MRTILVVFGTRPEAIKMSPLIHELQTRAGLRTVVCVTGQHREMLQSALRAFAVEPDYDLGVMQEGQTLFDVTSRVLTGMKAVIEAVSPDVVLVHGDTSTSFSAAIAAFYLGVPVGHVEAGLRTHSVLAPFPEEFNRRSISLVSTYNFAPTESARANLLAEGVAPASVFVTGNTAIDALRMTVKDEYSSEILDWARGGRMILLTAHRRENLGDPLRRMFRGIRRVVEETPDVRVVYPAHPNPAVRSIAGEVFGGCERVRIIDPLDVFDFHNILSRSFLVLTDSGGIQEEAPSLGKPVLVMRDSTERPEGVAAGTLKLIGTREESVYASFRELLDDEAKYREMSHSSNPYGDGYASVYIADALEYGKGAL